MASNKTHVEKLRLQTLVFISGHRLTTRGVGVYRYSLSCQQPTLYSSSYAAMTRHLLGDLDRLSDDGRAAWISYLNSHQDADGLYRDTVIFDQGWYAGDPPWCGRSHLTCHVITALACLGGMAEKPLRWLDPYRDVNTLIRWREERDWGARVAWTGNEIMNVGTLLQYARDFQNDDRAGHAVTALLEWLSTHHDDPETGVWGDVDVRDPIWRSHAVQAAYHWWPLFFYDGVPIPHVERAIDTVLATQNSARGFGCGVHNPADPLTSSACEDIDSIDPLCRMMQVTEYRREEIQVALTGAADWVLSNQVDDGGFVFIKDRSFEYGHPEMRNEANQGEMFSTWFRTLSLALIGMAMPDHPLGRIPWQFVHCPGMQLWTGN